MAGDRDPSATARNQSVLFPAQVDVLTRETRRLTTENNHLHTQLIAAADKLEEEGYGEFAHLFKKGKKPSE